MGVEENDQQHVNGNGRLLIDENGIGNKNKKSKFRYYLYNFKSHFPKRFLIRKAMIMDNSY